MSGGYWLMSTTLADGTVMRFAPTEDGATRSSVLRPGSDVWEHTVLPDDGERGEPLKLVVPTECDRVTVVPPAPPIAEYVPPKREP